MNTRKFGELRRKYQPTRTWVLGMLAMMLFVALLWPTRKALTQQTPTDPTAMSGSSPTVQQTPAPNTKATAELPSKRAGVSLNAGEISYRLPDFNLADFPAASARGNEIGKVRSMNLQVNSYGRVFNNSPGRIRLLTISSPGAKELRVHLTNFDLAPGDAVFVYGLTDDSPVAGPYVGKGPFGERQAKEGEAPNLWSDTIPGDTIVIEYISHGEERPFTVAEIMHNYKPFLTSEIPSPSLLNCHNDANCTNDNNNLAVAKISFTSGGSGFVCSATLLNSGTAHPSANDFPPYLLTARHCVSTTAEANTVQARWNYRSTSCNSGQEAAGITFPTGSYILNSIQAPEQTLLRMLHGVSSSWYVGWTTSGIPVNTVGYGLHHPDGSYLRRSTGNITSTNESCSTGLANGYRVDWSSGSIEGGSSGSGFFLGSTGQLIGVLSCRYCGPGPNCPTVCDADASYGKWANFYPDVSSYMTYGDYGTAQIPTPYPSANFVENSSLTTSTPTSRVYGVSYYGKIVSFNGLAGQTVVITQTSTAFDSWLYLLSPVTRELLAENDDYPGGGSNSRIGITLPDDGEYLIEASSFAAGATGAFQLQAQLCSFTASPTPQSFPAGGGNGSITVTCQAGCPWTATESASWITLNTASGTGNGTATFTVAANPGLARSATITVSGQTITINQAAAAACLTSTPINIGQTINGTLTAGDCQYTDGTLLDRYTFSGSIGQQVAISLNSTAFDAYLFLYNPAGGFIASNNDGGGGTNARIPATSGFFTLPATGTYTIYANSLNQGGAGAYTLSLIGGGTSLQFYPLPQPLRIVDTRPSQGNCDNVGSPISGGTSLTTLARVTCGSVTIPSTAQAIVGNITVINQTSQTGYLTIYPDGVTPPLAANMIYGPNGILANNFTVGLSSDGRFNVFGERTIHVIVDISGYYAPPNTGGLYYHPLSKPVRMLDTRASQGNCDSVGAPIAAGTALTTLARITCETLTIPAAAQAIVGNATVINGSGQTGYLTIYPDGIQPPLAANMIYFPGQVLSNAFTVGLSSNGRFNIFAERTIDVVIDVAGYYSTEATDSNGTGLLLTPLPRPLRVMDTRAAQGNCDSVGASIGGGTSLAVPGRLTCESIIIPTTARALLGNVTVINLTGSAGFLTLYPDGVTLPLAANMIYGPSQILSNAFVVGLNNSNGQFRVYAERTLEAIVDVSGYFAP
ncbi:MAG: pre-peptidase C-terminal domain-containing protein [Acidobacteria bacterium]|nr:pre-peptidase C-terminal domain-containing protein [Acidobacteriota bacterium]